MNENKFISNRAHTRIKYEPLRVSCQLVCITPQSPCAQSVNTTLDSPEWEPDRELSPTVVLPEIRVIDRNGVFPRGAGNASLSLDSLKWTVDGDPIADVWTMGDDADYTLVTDGDERGAIRIYKNLPAGAKAVLRFRGKMLDWRTGIVYQVESDDMPLTCTDKGEDQWKCSVDKPVVDYDPYKDTMLLYDYRQARGLSVVGTRADNDNGKGFEQRINVVLALGTKEQTNLPEGVTMRVVKTGTSTALTAGSAESPELMKATYPTVTFDMRLIDKASYDIQFVMDGKVICHASVGLSTKCTMPTAGKPESNTDITTGMNQYMNNVLLLAYGQEIVHPELLYNIQWHTQAKTTDINGNYIADAVKDWQRGESMQATIRDIGMGSKEADSCFELWFDVDAWGALNLLTDESGNVLTDESGNMLIG